MTSSRLKLFPAASYTRRIGPIKVTIWPRSCPWLVQIGQRQWWLFDRGQNLG